MNVWFADVFCFAYSLALFILVITVSLLLLKTAFELFMSVNRSLKKKESNKIKYVTVHRTEDYDTETVREHLYTQDMEDEANDDC